MNPITIFNNATKINPSDSNIHTTDPITMDITMVVKTPREYDSTPIFTTISFACVIYFYPNAKRHIKGLINTKEAPVVNGDIVIYLLVPASLLSFPATT